MNEQELNKAISGLPREFPPERDLWPGIEARLDERHEAAALTPSRRWPLALAASVVLAFSAGLLSGRLMGPGDGVEQVSGTEFAMKPTPGLMFQAALMESELEYQAAFREFIPVGYAKGRFDEAVLASIENAWSDLQQQESDLLSALKANPGNAYLGQTLLGLRARQLEFLRQMAGLDQTSWRTT